MLKRKRNRIRNSKLKSPLSKKKKMKLEIKINNRRQHHFLKTRNRSQCQNHYRNPSNKVLQVAKTNKKWLL